MVIQKGQLRKKKTTMISFMANLQCSTMKNH